MFRMILTLAAWWLAAGVSIARAAVAPSDLRCERQVSPLAVDQVHPAFSWLVQAERLQRGIGQSAYQIQVASTAARLESGPHVWDSGKIDSDQSVAVAYAGPALASKAIYVWRVRVTTDKGDTTAWSVAATFGTGVYATADWKGQWIAAFNREDTQSNLQSLGYRAESTDKPQDPKWVQVDLGEQTAIDQIIVHPAAGKMAMMHNGFPAASQFMVDLMPSQYRVDVSDDPAFAKFMTVATRKPEVGAIFSRSRHTSDAIETPGARGRYVRFTAMFLWPQRLAGDKPWGMAVGELEVISGGKNVALNKQVTAKDSVERDGWGAAKLTDGQGLGDPLIDLAADSALLFRKQVALEQKPVRATAYVCGLGYFELSVNGKKAGDHVLDPGFTDYTRRQLYVAHDITPMLQAGENAIGMTLGNGWYREATPDQFGYERAQWRAPLKLILNIELEYADGSHKTISSNASWKWNTSKIVFNCIRGGEVIDARVDRSGWDLPGFDDSAWKPTVAILPPQGKLVAQAAPPIRLNQEIKPVALSEPSPGVYVYDLGVNISGWARFKATGSAGQTIDLYHNEILLPAGSVDIGHCAYFSFGRFQQGTLICSGKPGDLYEPRFTYHGFRYVEIHGLKYKPKLEDLTGCWVTTDPEAVGEFACSNETVNQILTVYKRTQLNNMESIPTDCPTREKMGWTQDGCVTQEAAIFNFGVENFYAKWLVDLQDAQDPNGHVGAIAPTAGWGRSAGGNQPGTYSCPWWGGAVVRTPWNLYLYYGDKQRLADSYNAMRAYTEFMASTTKDDILRWGLGDWLDESADREVKRDFGRRKAFLEITSTAAFYNYNHIMSEAAKVLGKTQDAEKYGHAAERIAKRYNEVFYNAATGEYARDAQTAQSLSLALGLVPADRRSKVEDAFIRNIMEERKGHINSGIVGTLYVFHALEQMNRNDVAYTVFSNPTYPSLAYMISKGATAFWESWSDPAGLSHNHPALGSPIVWLYRDLAGIRPDLARPGFKHTIIKPAVVGDLTWVKASYRSPFGLIRSEWKLENGMVTYRVTVPANTSATVYIATPAPAQITESGRAISDALDIKEVGSGVFDIGSGEYIFSAKKM